MHRSSRTWNGALAALAVVALVAGCAAKNDLDKPPPPLGQLKLGLNIVVAKNAQKSPISRSATPEEWQEALKKAMADRFGRYKGDRFYDFGINVDGYALAPPGIPVIAAPKSVLVITANVWDDPARQRLNLKGKQLIVTEGLSGDTVIGSGLTQTKAQQMARLSYNAAKKVEQWLLSHPEWFPDKGAAVPEAGAPGPDGKPAPAPAKAARPARPDAKAVPDDAPSDAPSGSGEATQFKPLP